MGDSSNIATDEDREEFEKHGIRLTEIERQWSILAGHRRPIILDRACTVGDGIVQLAASEHDPLVTTHRDSASRGRWLKFVPASGAASRMFALRSADETQRFCAAISQFAFADELQKRLPDRGVRMGDFVRTGRHAELVEAIVTSAGLGYGDLPKGLVEFHRYQNDTRTPFEEHLLESQACLSDRDGTVSAHFTVAPEHQDRFVERLNQFTSGATGHFQVSFSVQHSATDTIAMDANGALLRGDDRKPVLRPGGHGALLENLNELQGDLIFVKNIDNVAHEHWREASVVWLQILGGYLRRLQDAVHEHLRGLNSHNPRSVVAAREFVHLTFPGTALPATEDPNTLREVLIARLKRPLRVCGMVKNAGEPGGGPFWVREADGGISAQIVETVEVDTRDARQQAIVEQATHFNPVFMALAVRDENGELFDLREFSDEDRVIITQKPVGGQTATVLERPGLWNGAMARWNSVFIELPKEVFSPVKTVFDLLRQEHQPLATR